MSRQVWGVTVFFDDHAESQRFVEALNSGEPLQIVKDVAGTIRHVIELEDPSWNVHNHGPDEGRGTACREYHLNGRLVGACKLSEALQL